LAEFQYPDAHQRQKAVLEILEALNETGATCILTTDYTSVTSVRLEQFMTLDEGLEQFLHYIDCIQFEKQLFHGVISMQTKIQKAEHGEGREMAVRAISVEKMRETQIDRQPRPYEITERGIEVYPIDSVVTGSSENDNNTI
jgi:KaiC/GvpD/RAD55 family RecA-like ATPase